MSNFNQPFPNLQEELYHMEQQLQHQQQEQKQQQPNYNQREQTRQGQGFGQPDRAMDPVYHMEGPSFTGEASVFHQGNRSRSREERGYGDRARSLSPRGRDGNGYNESRFGQSGSYERSRSGKRSHSRERDYHHRSRSRSPSGDYRSGGSSDSVRLQETLKRLQQLEQQQRVQDQLLKDVRVHLKPTSEPKRRRIDEPFQGGRDRRDSQGSSLGPPGPHSANPARKPICFNCGELGHFAAHCAAKRQRTSEPPGCFNCGKSGHIAAKCPAALSRQREQEGGCFKCGKRGHIAAQCPAGSRQSEPPGCFNCGRPGHIAAQCPKPRKRDSDPPGCFNCGRPGHIAAQCPKSRPREDPPGCFNCGRPGHIAAQCPAKSRPREPDPFCFNCGRPGHIAAQCSAKSRPRGSSDPLKAEGRCYRCGGEGHQAKHCKFPYVMGSGPDQKRKPDGDQGMLGKIQNSHVKCYRCEGFGHYVRECPTKHTAAALIITPSKKSKEPSKTGPVHIDAETALVIDTIYGMAKTHYPVPEGCKTRLEIDDNLKRKGEKHKIADKDVPPLPRRSNTTLSNQCDIMDRLWWKDMLYDRVLENLYCLTCQKDFRTEKQYQDHINGRMHRNLNSSLLGAKTGWAVRTKILKKLGSLPTIFEETLPGEEKKPFPDIKPDLLSENAEDKKFFVCRVCKTWAETPFQSHFESKRHKFLYENQWKCEVCNMYFRGYEDFKKHADSLIHKQVMKKTKGITSESEDDTTPSRKRSSETPDKPTAAKKLKITLTKEEEGLIEMVWASEDQWNIGESTSQDQPGEESSESESEEATESTKDGEDGDKKPVPGLQFLVPVAGFYCKLCGDFYSEDKVPKEEHCQTKMHRSRVKSWNRTIKKRALAAETGLDDKKSEGADEGNVKEEDGKTGEGESEVKDEDEDLEKKEKENENEQQPSEVDDQQMQEDESESALSVGKGGNVERLKREQEDLDVDVVGDEVLEGSKADGSELESKMDVDADEMAVKPGGSEGEESKANDDDVKDEIEDSQHDEGNQKEAPTGNNEDGEKPDITADSEDEDALLLGDTEDDDEEKEGEEIQGSGEGENPLDESEEKDEKQTEDDDEKPHGSDESDEEDDTVIDESKRQTRRGRATRSKANKASPKKGTKRRR